MDLVLSVVGEVLIMLAVALDLRRQAAVPSGGEIEPFRIWALRVYFFNVLAIPFYLWRTRGRFRWFIVGAALGFGYLLLLNLAVIAAGGCSATAPEGRRGTRDGRVSDGTRDAGAAVASGPAATPPSLDLGPALSDLRSARFSTVRAAEERIVRQGGVEAVVALVEMARDRTRAPLVETDELVYPGGRRFHGRGPVVPYDIDRLGARAGWALEELTFRDFGFRRAPFPLAEAPREDPAAAEKAAAWWTAQNGRFERVGAAVTAIGDGEGVHRDALVAALEAAPLEPQIERALRGRIVPALRDALGRAHGDHRAALCRAARALWLGELHRDHPALGPVFDRHLAGDANLLEAVSVAMAPEVRVTSEVPGAADILAPPYATSAARGLLELVRRVQYAHRSVGLEISAAGDAITLYAGDDEREAASWIRLLARQ